MDILTLTRIGPHLPKTWWQAEAAECKRNMQALERAVDTARNSLQEATAPSPCNSLHEILAALTMLLATRGVVQYTARGDMQMQLMRAIFSIVKLTPLSSRLPLFHIFFGLCRPQHKLSS